MTLLANSVIMGSGSRYFDRYIGSNNGFCFDVFRRFSSYTGDCLEVERDSDNTTLDIGFDEDDYLDVGAIETFCSGTEGRVRTWYDQCPNHVSGYGGEVTKTTFSNMPIIYTGGALIEKNGIVALDFQGGSGDDMRATFTGLTRTSIVFLGVGSWDSGTSNGSYISLNDASDQYIYQMFRITNNVYTITRRNGGHTDGTSVAGSTTLIAGDQHIGGAFEDINDRWVYLDGVQDGYNGNNANTFGGIDTILIGSYRLSGANSYFNGKIQASMAFLMGTNNNQITMMNILNKDYGTY